MTEPTRFEQWLREQTTKTEAPTANLDWRTPPLVELDLTTVWKDEER